MQSDLAAAEARAPLMLRVSRWELLMVCLLLLGVYASRQTGALPGQTIGLVDVVFAAAALWLAMRAAHVQGRIRTVHLGIAVTSIVIAVVGVLASSESLQRIAEGISAYALAAALLFVLYVTLSEDNVTGDTLFGALAAYLAMAVIFAMIYTLIARHDPSSFEPAQPVIDGQTDLHYFSFVTITSLGFGDIAPASDLVRVIVPIEAIVGAILIAALVGRIVGLLVAQTSSVRTRRRLDEIMVAVERLDRPESDDHT